MLKSLSERVVEWQIKKLILKEDDRAMYEYAYLVLICHIINIAVAVIIALVFSSAIPVMVFLISYIPLRSFAGGYHASNSERCVVVSAVILCIVCLIMKVIATASIPVINWSIAMIAGIVIYMLSPVEDPNKPLEGIEVKRYRTRARGTWLSEIIISVLFYMAGFEEVSYIITLSHMILAIILCIGNRKLKYRMLRSNS